MDIQLKTTKNKMTNKQTNEQTNKESEKKKLGQYTLNLKTSFNNKDSDKIFLNLSVNKPLQDLLKDCVINETIKFSSFGEGEVLTRYRVKKWVYNSVYEEAKAYLFVKNFIDSGKLKVGFLNVTNLDDVNEGIKKALREVVKILNNYKDVKTTINYEVEDRQ